MAKETTRRSPGDGTIRRRSTGSYEARVSFGLDEATGKRIQKSVYGSTRSEVKRKMNALLDEYEEQQANGGEEKPFAKGQMKYTDWLDTWMTEYKLNSLSPATYESYRLAIDNHIRPKLGNLALIDIKPEHIQTFLNSMQKPGSRLDKNKGALSSAFTIKMKNIINASIKQAVRNRMIPWSPVDAVTPPKLRQKEIRILTKEEQAKLMTAVKGHRLEALFKLALATGMRKGELLGLTWDCIDFEKKTIQIKRSISRIKDPETRESYISEGSTKTKAGQRMIPMLPSVIPILEQHRQRQETEKAVAGSAYNSKGIVFCSNVGTYIETRRINRALETMIRKAGIEHVTFHSLRHTFATRALENGIPAKVVQEVLGHSDVSLTLNTYSHVLQSTAHEQMSKLNSLFEEVTVPMAATRNEHER